MRSAIRLRMSERSPRLVRPQAGAAAWAASSAASMSSAVPRATSQNGLPLTGEMFSNQRPFFGSTQLPPMKWP